MKNGVYNSIGGVVRLLVALALVPILIRIIGMKEFGLWSLAFAVVGVAGVVEIGISWAVTVFSAQDLAQANDQALSQTLTASLVTAFIIAFTLTAILFLRADAIVGLFSKLTPEDRVAMAKALPMGGLLVATRLTQQVLIGLQQAFQRFGPLNAILTIQSLALGVAMVVTAVHGGRTATFMLVQVLVGAGALVAHAIMGYRLLHNKCIRFSWSTNKSRQMFKFGLLTMTSSIGGVLFSQCDRLVVGAFLDTPTLGVYAAITTITTQINSISSLPVQPLLARVGHYWTDKTESVDTRREIEHTTQFNALLAFSVAAAVFVIAPVICTIVFHGNTNQTMIIALRCASVIYASYSLNATGYFILPAIGALALHTAIQVAGGVFAVLLIWFGSHNWGLLGAVLGNSGYVITVALTVLALRRMHIKTSQALNWIRFPLGWFVITIMTSIALPATITIECTLLVGSMLILAWWTFTTYSHLIRQWRNQLSHLTA